MSQRGISLAAGSVSFLAFLSLAAGPDPACAQSPSITFPTETQTQMGNITFSIDAEIGQVGGTAYERVYDYPRGERFKVSELKWDLENVAMVGVRGQVGFANRFRVNLGYWTAVSEGDGDMVDTDWDYAEAIHRGYIDADSVSDDDWTHQSRHPDTDLDSGSIVDLNFDFKAFSRGSFSLSGIVGYRQNEWEWSSRGGSYVYSYDRNDDGYYSPAEWRTYQGDFEELYGDDVLVIKYRQEYSMPYLGLGLEGAWGAFQLQGHLLYSPWVSAEDHDYHSLRKMTYDGDFSGGDWFGADITGKWFFTPRWYATLGAEYQKFDEIIGDAEAYGAEGWGDFDNGGGVELETVMLLLGVGFRF